MTASAHNYSILTSFIVIVMLAGLVSWLVLEYKSYNTTDIRVGDHTLQIEIADDFKERVRGLSGRETLKPRTGMLFVYPEGDNTCIWMKDMRFPIDIMWFDATGTLTDIKANVSPYTFPNSFCPASPAKYVLEMPAGSAEELNFLENKTQLEAVAF